MRRFQYCFIIFIFIFIFMSLAVANNSQQKISTPSNNIVFYLHINVSTMVVNLAANSSMASPGVSALLQAIEYPMSSSAEGGDEIGTARGLSLWVGSGILDAVGGASQADLGEVLVATIDYDDGIVIGSINLQGHFVAGDSHAEVAVVGGTHAFRRVQGYGNPSLISQSSLSAVVRWELQLFYPTAQNFPSM